MNEFTIIRMSSLFIQLLTILKCPYFIVLLILVFNSNGNFENKQSAQLNFEYYYNNFVVKTNTDSEIYFALYYAGKN